MAAAPDAAAQVARHPRTGSRCARVAHGRATGACPRGRLGNNDQLRGARVEFVLDPTHARTPSRCGRRRRPRARRRSCPAFPACTSPRPCQDPPRPRRTDSAYPVALTGLAQWLMPVQANGSLERSPDGTIIGSRLIGQFWNGPEWFHGRPSATTGADPNDPTVPPRTNAASSGASNLGPTSKELAERLSADRKALERTQPELAGSKLPGPTC